MKENFIQKLKDHIIKSTEKITINKTLTIRNLGLQRVSEINNRKK